MCFLQLRTAVTKSDIQCVTQTTVWRESTGMHTFLLLTQGKGRRFVPKSHVAKVLPMLSYMSGCAGGLLDLRWYCSLSEDEKQAEHVAHTNICKFSKRTQPNLWILPRFCSDSTTQLVFQFFCCFVFFLINVICSAFNCYRDVQTTVRVVFSPAVLLPNPQERTDVCTQMLYYKTQLGRPSD